MHQYIDGLVQERRILYIFFQKDAPEVNASQTYSSGPFY